MVRADESHMPGTLDLNGNIRALCSQIEEVNGIRREIPSPEISYKHVGPPIASLPWAIKKTIDAVYLPVRAFHAQIGARRGCWTFCPNVAETEELIRRKHASQRIIIGGIEKNGRACEVEELQVFEGRTHETGADAVITGGTERAAISENPALRCVVRCALQKEAIKINIGSGRVGIHVARLGKFKHREIGCVRGL